MDSLQIIYSQSEAIEFYKNNADILRDTAFNYAAFLITVTGILIPLLFHLWIRSDYDKYSREVQKLRDDVINNTMTFKQKLSESIEGNKAMKEKLDRVEKDSLLRMEFSIGYQEAVRYKEFVYNPDYKDSQKENLIKALQAYNQIIRVGFYFKDKNVPRLIASAKALYVFAQQSINADVTVQDKGGISQYIKTIDDLIQRNPDENLHLKGYCAFLKSVKAASPEAGPSSQASNQEA